MTYIYIVCVCVCVSTHMYTYTPITHTPNTHTPQYQRRGLLPPRSPSSPLALIYICIYSGTETPQYQRRGPLPPTSPSSPPAAAADSQTRPPVYLHVYIQIYI